MSGHMDMCVKPFGEVCRDIKSWKDELNEGASEWTLRKSGLNFTADG